MSDLVFAPLFPKLLSAVSNAFFWSVAAVVSWLAFDGSVVPELGQFLSRACLLFGVVLSVRAFRIRLTISHGGLELRNLLVTRRVPWSSVRAILPGGSLVSLSSTACPTLVLYRTDRRWGTAIQATATWSDSALVHGNLLRSLRQYDGVHEFVSLT